MNSCKKIKWIFGICCSLFLLPALPDVSVSAAETETISAASEDELSVDDTASAALTEETDDTVSASAESTGSETEITGQTEDPEAAGDTSDAQTSADEAAGGSDSETVDSEDDSAATCATEEEKAAAFTTAANFNAPIYTDPETGITYTQTFSGETITVCGSSYETALAADDPEEYVAILKAQTSSFYWEGSCLNEYDGVNRGPSGKETWYNLNMSTIVSVLHSKGYEGEYWVRSDGVKMFGCYILCAADYSTYSYGTIVETSLGTGIIADTGCARGVVDIAVAW